MTSIRCQHHIGAIFCQSPATWQKYRPAVSRYTSAFTNYYCEEHRPAGSAPYGVTMGKDAAKP